MQEHVREVRLDDPNCLKFLKIPSCINCHIPYCDLAKGNVRDVDFVGVGAKFCLQE